MGFEHYCENCGKKLPIGESRNYQLGISFVDGHYDNIYSEMPQYKVYCVDCKNEAFVEFNKLIKYFNYHNDNIIQIQNPKTKKYVMINKTKGEILEHKETDGPYKNIPIYKITKEDKNN